jgi:hypothetical protein
MIESVQRSQTAVAKSGKADFGSIYNSKDPHSYYSTLGALEYRVPQHGIDVFRQLRGAYPYTGAKPLTVLDVCCSYGVGGVLATTDIDLAELYRHYEDSSLAGLTGDEMIQADLKFLAGRRRPDAPRMLGLDVAENAARYAIAIGALDDAFVENLESDEPSLALVQQIRDVDLICTTGGVGYISERTFRRLLASARKIPWVASFCLRTYDYGPIAAALAEYGLVTERSDLTFAQRIFRDQAEQQWAISNVLAIGLDPTGLESDGHLYANFYLSRPAAEAKQRPLPELVAARST